ncbi:iron ABC transporter substrate-binding protein [Planosporangium flavigriseum]|uniref:Iron ABC transporter substrate-binding protein n=1 Tax=Planosporangium flavigriseum TaxID=373681 RepID=A0A8J3PPY4_9ACTN|nr:iron ABC transporter substrate-binding protein [Planosporangium flavigriseum]NJC65478.1 iron ABC transporter substrate-binding protein [Planosporangium flavigriseum]GIG76398.1 iron ABC transporter substrate-binding protein [Planosporangium flavigriseum]
MGTGGRRVLAVVAALTVALGAAACGGGSKEAGSADSSKTITLYNAQHEPMMKALVDGFTKETGIKVKFRNGKDSELANQLVQEGAATPADVFVTENSPAMTLVDSKGGFAKLDGATLSQVPKQYVPSTGNWMGFAARSTVFVYNSKQVTKEQLPASIMDITQPQWKNKIGVAAAGADFQAIVSAILAVKGEAATAEWLKGLKANAKVYQGNGAVMKAVNAGEISAGVIYHYYWYNDRAESGANSKDTELLFWGNKDPGAFVSVSGAGVLKASKHQAEAQQFVTYLTGKAGQKILADGNSGEYSISAEVPTNSKLKPLSELSPPDVDVAKLNGPKVVELMQQAGLL